MTLQMTAAPRRSVLMVGALAAAAVLAVGFASPAGAKGATLPPNWHVHDCPPASTCVPPHQPTSFFPYILGQTLDEYLADPAMCPNATDKAFLPPGLEAGQPLRAGVCMTSTTVIHLRSIPEGDPSPEGWALIPITVPGGRTVIDGVAYRTYFRLSAH